MNLPPSLPAPKLWIDPDAVTGIANGGQVDPGNVVDGSGFGNGPNRGTHRRPTLLREAVNGHAALRFADGQRFYATPYIDEPRTIVAVYRLLTADSEMHLAWADSSAAGMLEAYSLKPVGGSAGRGCVAFSRTNDADTNIAQKIGLRPQTSDGWMVLIGTQDGKFISLWHGRELLQSTRMTQPRPISQGLIIGASFAEMQISGGFKGDLGLFGVFDVVLNDAQREALLEHLAARFFPHTLNTGSGYALCTFNGAATNPAGLVMAGQNGWQFTRRVGMAYYPAHGHVRDGNLLQRDGWWYQCYTNGMPGGAFRDTNQFAVAKSNDGVYWQTCARISMEDMETGDNRRTWSPVWFEDDDGTVWCLITTNSDGWTERSTAYVFTLSGPDFTLRGQPRAITGRDIPEFQIAGDNARRNDGSYLFCTKLEQTQNVKAAMSFHVSPHIAGPYELLLDASDWGQVEGGLMLRLPDGKLRVYYDHFIANTGMAFRDSADEGKSWSVETRVAGDESFPVRNGGVVRL